MSPEPKAAIKEASLKSFDTNEPRLGTSESRKEDRGYLRRSLDPHVAWLAWLISS